MEKKIQGALQSVLADGGPGGPSFTVKSTECHSTMCTAQVSWQSIDVARQEFGTVLDASREIPCASRMTLDPSGAGRGEYGASVIIDCKSSLYGRDTVLEKSAIRER